LRFLPGGNNLPVLTELVRTFIGFEYCWEIELQLKPHAAPPAVCRAWPDSVRTISVPAHNGHLDLVVLMMQLGRQQINSIWVEAGP
ncbi:type VI secretion system baseplate subunit TssG, partial [Salmonella enterica subsp. enterica serovar Kentucky]|nr:type VI secretion system baseplate subunit TssG [Salmonella enterica subsp. enterica serovar Kentucky]